MHLGYEARWILDPGDVILPIFLESGKAAPFIRAASFLCTVP